LVFSSRVRQRRNRRSDRAAASMELAEA
jgi:hypothetical protein